MTSGAARSRGLAYGLLGAGIGLALPVLSGLVPAARTLGAPLVVADPIRPVDAIVVLGAGAYDAGTLTPDSAYRLVRGVQLFRAGHAPLLILSGGGHRGTRVSDARAMANVAASLGLDAASVLVDDMPSSTSQQAQSVARIAGERRIRSIALVTSPLHSYRASRTFRRAGLQVVSAPAGPDFDPRLLTVGADHVAGRLNIVVAALYEYVAIAAYRLSSRF